MVDVRDNEDVIETEEVVDDKPISNSNDNFGKNRDLSGAVAYYPTKEKPARNQNEMMIECMGAFASLEGVETYPYFCADAGLTVGCGTLVCINGKENDTGRFDLCGFNEKQKEYLLGASSIVAKGLLRKVDGACNVEVFKDTGGNRHIIQTSEEGKKEHFILEGETLKPFTGDCKRTGDTYFMEVERIPNAGVRVKSVSRNSENFKVLMPEISKEQANYIVKQTFGSYYAPFKNNPNFKNFPLTLQNALMHQVYGFGPGGFNKIAAKYDMKTIDGAVACCDEALKIRNEENNIQHEINSFNNFKNNVLSKIKDNVNAGEDGVKYASRNYIELAYAQVPQPLMSADESIIRLAPDKFMGHRNSRDQLAFDMKKQSNSSGLENVFSIRPVGYSANPSKGEVYRILDVETSLDELSVFGPEARASISKEMKSDAENSENGYLSYISDKLVDGWEFLKDGYNRFKQKIDERCNKTEPKQNAASSLSKIGGMNAILNSRGGR